MSEFMHSFFGRIYTEGTDYRQKHPEYFFMFAKRFRSFDILIN